MKAHIYDFENRSGKGLRIGECVELTRDRETNRGDPIDAFIFGHSKSENFFLCLVAGKLDAPYSYSITGYRE